MTRTELKEYIQNNYGTEPDYPWGKHQNHEVYRHINSKKMVCPHYGCAKKQAMFTRRLCFRCS